MSTVGLPISRLVNVGITLSPLPAQAPSINSLLVLGNSDVIDTTERMRQYLTLGAVGTDFSNTSPEYLAAQAWFDQSPQPTQLLVGRWAQTATNGRLTGAVLSANQQLLANFIGISNGSFNITINGTPTSVSGLNFTSVTNLNGVATIVNANMPSATMKWNGQYGYFTIESNTTGASSTVSFMTPGSGGTDTSPLFLMRGTDSGAYATGGMASETALTAVQLFDTMFADQWYALFIPTAADSDHIAVAGYIEGASVKHYYGVNTQEAGVLVSSITSDIAYQLMSLGYNDTAVQYSSSSQYAIASYLGRILTTNWQANNSTITLMYKQEPGVIAETLTGSQIAALEGKNCNVFVAYNNNTQIIERGTSASGQFTDTIIGMDWLANELQTAWYNLLYGTPTKIPQTDAGNHMLATVAEGVMVEAVNNGLIAPGQWNSNGFGSLNTGDFLSKGYYVFLPPISSQPESLRATRVSVPIQIAVKLAGAIQTVDGTIFVNA